MTLLLAAFVPSASAANANFTKLTHLTFSGPVQLPGVVLPGGTYTFTRMTPNVILVRSKDHSTVYGMFMTIPRLRWGWTAKEEIVFREVPAGAVPAIEAWFPRPRTWNRRQAYGHEFLYSE
jgi:hypothetical protein